MNRVDVAACERAYQDWVRERDPGVIPDWMAQQINTRLAQQINTWLSRPLPDWNRLIVGSPANMTVNNIVSNFRTWGTDLGTVDLGPNATPGDVNRFRERLGLPDPDPDLMDNP